jgi:ABC-type transport system involved in Fe-S cluster assembly fused permease/ATPase subunit
MSVNSQIAQDWSEAIKAANKNSLLQAQARYVDAGIFWNMDTYFNGDSFKLMAGAPPLQKFLQELGHEKSKKAEATLLLVIGEKSPCGAWVIGKCKNVWLKPIKQ